MIQSMTAFARAQSQGSWGSVVCEIRTINHRYLELIVRVPETLHELEISMRECLRGMIKRGKVECILRYQPSDADGAQIIINSRLVKQLCEANEKITQMLKSQSVVNTMDILHWPGILQIAELDLETIEDEVLKLLKTCLKELIAARQREGEELRTLFFQRLDSMKEELSKVKQRMPMVLAQQRERLINRFRDAKIELDSNRLEQEIVLFVQKIDISEEMERIDAHISEVRRILKQGGVAGRRLDFLMQELNREANTLGAKSVDVDITRVSVELKVLIEQMREQVQNVE